MKKSVKKSLIVLVSIILLSNWLFFSNAVEETSGDEEFQATVEYKYNKETNVVTAIIHSNKKMAETKNPKVWVLSDDGLTYTNSNMIANGSYYTTVKDLEGNAIAVLIDITLIDDKAPEITMEYVKNSDGTVTAVMHSNEVLGDTKLTWILSEDKLSYSKTFSTNQKYTTPVEDIYGNVTNVLVEITSISGKLSVTTSYTYNKETNIATVEIHSNNKMKETKNASVWSLSEDGLTYTNASLKSNGSYYTTVEDIYGDTVSVLIEVTSIDDKGPEITLNYTTNSDGTVTVTMNSNEVLGDTKPTWTLNEDKLSYTKTFSTNQKYTTPVEDVYGNTTNVLVEITGTREKLSVTTSYTYNKETNIATVKIHSNNKMKETKNASVWSLSEDGLTYTNESLKSNGSYYTTVEDIYGDTVSVLIEVTSIDDKGPEITLNYTTNSDGTVTVTMNSNEVLGDTKPTWTLSKDKLSYSKTFSTSQKYTTPVEDVYGNVTNVKIVIRINKDIQDYTTIDESKYPGFKAALQALKDKHPDWNIKVYYTNINWDDFINAEDETVGGSPKSLTQYPYLGAWCKGSETYDVSNSWYRATKNAIRYMADPRNSLEDAWFFQFQDLSSSSGTRQEIKKMVSGTFLDTDSAITAILEAAQENGVSPFHIVARILQEQGRDGSGIMNGYEYLGKKVYNLYNINVSGNASTGTLAGARYAYSKGWFSMEDSIKGGAEFLTTNYIDVGQSTLYFQKYNVINKNSLFSHQYMQNIRGANDEGNSIYRTYVNSGILDSHFEFIIPLYENMPQSACARPSTT